MELRLGGNGRLFMEGWLDTIHWDARGLVPVITQESDGSVLMHAWMNRDALLCTVKEGYAVYWSRSRQRLWKKGESSENTQKVIDLYLDCDNDTLLLTVQQTGGIACHTGKKSCFFRHLIAGKWVDLVDEDKNNDSGGPSTSD